MERQIRNWRRGEARPQGPARERLVDLHYVVGRLRRVYRDEGVDIWLHAKNLRLDGARPIELLIAGAFEHVLLEIEALEGGGA